jgi:hypothetical protein
VTFVDEKAHRPIRFSESMCCNPFHFLDSRCLVDGDWNIAGFRLQVLDRFEVELARM